MKEGKYNFAFKNAQHFEILPSIYFLGDITGCLKKAHWYFLGCNGCCF